MPLDAAIVNYLPCIAPVDAMVIEFDIKIEMRYCKMLSKASIQQVQNRHSTQLIKAKSCLKRLDATIQAEDLSCFSSYQTLTMGKNWQSYLSPMKLVKKGTVMIKLFRVDI
jgi:hypothetical protein